MRSILVLALATASIPVAAHGQDSAAALQKKFILAVMSNNASKVAGCFADDALVFPVGPELVLHGREAVRESWQRFFEVNRVNIVQVRDSGSEPLGDAVLAWGAWTMTFTPKAGGASVTLQGRFTDVSKNVDGKWLYTVDHPSVPYVPPGAPASDAMDP